MNGNILAADFHFRDFGYLDGLEHRKISFKQIDPPKNLRHWYCLNRSGLAWKTRRRKRFCALESNKISARENDSQLIRILKQTYEIECNNCELVCVNKFRYIAWHKTISTIALYLYNIQKGIQIEQCINVNNGMPSENRFKMWPHSSRISKRLSNQNESSLASNRLCNI